LQGAAYRKVNEKFPYWLEGNKGINPLNSLAKKMISRVESLKFGKQRSYKRSEIQMRFSKVNTDFFRKYFDTENQFMQDQSTSFVDEMIEIDDVEKIIENLLDAVFTIVGLTMHDADANYLRDIAVKIEQKNEPTLQDALALMRLAKRARPNGPFICQKIDEWNLRLNEIANADAGL
jgi:hypothetical protein